MRLYEAVDRFIAARDWIEEHGEEIERAGGAIPDELIDEFDKAFEADEALEEKVEAVIAAERDLRSKAERASEEAERLRALAKSYAREADAVKTYLGIQLRRAGVRRLDTSLGKAGHYWSTRPSIDLYADKIPEVFKRTKVEESLDGNSAYETLKVAGLLPDREEEDGVPVQSAKILEAGTEIEIEGEKFVLDAPLILRLGTYFRVW